MASNRLARCVSAKILQDNSMSLFQLGDCHRSMFFAGVPPSGVWSVLPRGGCSVYVSFTRSSRYSQRMLALSS